MLLRYDDSCPARKFGKLGISVRQNNGKRRKLSFWDPRARPATENGLMNGETPESAIRHGNPRALSLGGQSILLGAALTIGTSMVGWMALNAMGSAAIWRS